jgi:hypothetical protein
MIKTSLIFIFCIISLQNYCQAIYGVVFDNSTKKTIPFANVFFNSSTVGTQTDESGSFKLLLPNNQKLPIAITSIGYVSELISDYSAEFPLSIYLSPKIYSLDEVYVFSKMSPADRKRRQQNINLFKEQFLGTSLYSKSCEILNEKDLILNYNEEKDLLKVFSYKPLIINNKALGYQIIYYLNTFEYSPSHLSLIFMGSFIFKEDQKLNKLKRIIVEKKRRLAYHGSQMQFFRSLWENNLDSDGFDIKNASNRKLTYDSLVVQTDPGAKYLKYDGIARIFYYSKMNGTAIQMQKDSVYFDKLGYYDPLGIRWIWGGVLTNQRMGDQLPFDYNPKQKPSIKVN